MSSLSRSDYYTAADSDAVVAVFPPPKLVWAAVLVSAAISLVVCAAVVSQQLLLGDRNAGWLYPYVATFDLRAAGAALIALALSVALLTALPKPDHRNEWLVVTTWIVMGVALELLIRSVGPFSMRRVFLSDEANAFYRVTQISDPATVLRNFADARASWPLHAQSNMPGKIMLLFGLQWLASRPEVLTWLIVALSSAGGALMYVFVRDLLRDRTAALFSLVLYLFVPARLFFLPLLNTVTPTVFLVCACLLLRWVQTGNTRHAGAAGVALYALIFFEPLPLTMGLLFVSLIVRSLVRREISARRIAIDTAAGLAAFIVAHVTMRAVFHFDLFDALRRVTAHAVEFNVHEARPYSYWLFGNLREFAFGMGICQAALFLLFLFDSMRTARGYTRAFMTPIAVVTTSLALILLITDLLGINRGEVIRLWIFLACFVQIPSAYACARLGQGALLVVLASTIIQTVIAMSMIGFVVL